MGHIKRHGSSCEFDTRALENHTQTGFQVYHRHSSAKTTNAFLSGHIDRRRMDEDAALLLLTIQMTTTVSLCVCVPLMLILFCSLPVSQNLHPGSPPPQVELGCGCLCVALKAAETPCRENANAGLEQIKKSVFMQRKWKVNLSVFLNVVFPSLTHRQNVKHNQETAKARAQEVEIQMSSRQVFPPLVLDIEQLHQLM